MPLTRADLRQISLLIQKIVNDMRLGAIVEAINSQTNAISKQVEGSNKTREPQPPRYPERISAEVDFPPEKTQRDQADQKKSHRLQWATFWTGLLSLATLGVYTEYTRRQFHAFELSNAINVKIAESALKSTEAAQGATRIAPEAMKATQDQFRQDQRPYIWITKDLGQPSFIENSGQFVWTYHITNYGKSPAYKLICHQFTKIGNLTFPQFGSKFSIGPPMPPMAEQFNTAVSSPGITRESFDRLF